jgi:hypothetical protein
MAKKSNEIAQLGKTHEKAERIRNAVTAYNRDPNLSMRDAATIFKCSPQSVSNHVKQQNDQANSSDPMMHLPDAYVDLQLLTPGEEASLIQHIKCCSDSGLALTKILLFGFVHELLKQNGRDRSVGKKWHLRFYKRHPDVEAKYCRPMEKARVVNENAAEYIEWFQQVFKTIIEWDIQLADTWNMDESGAGICQSSRRYGAEGPGQLLIKIRNLGCNRGRDGYALVPRRGRAISITPFKGPAVSALAL